MLAYSTSVLVLLLTIFNCKIAHSSALQDLNSTSCDILRSERRTQIYNSAQIDKIDSLNKQFISKISPQDMIKLTQAAKVPKHNPAWFDQTKLDAEIKSIQDFNEIASNTASKLGLNLNGKKYTRADIIDARSPSVKITTTTPTYRESIVATKPSIAVGRVYTDSKNLKLDYLKKFPTIIFAVVRDFGDASRSNQAELQIIVDGMIHDMGWLVEQTLPANCFNPEAKYSESYNSVDKTVKDDSRGASKPVPSGVPSEVLKNGAKAI